MNKLITILGCLFLSACSDSVVDIKEFTVTAVSENPNINKVGGKYCCLVRDGTDDGFWFYTDQEIKVGDKLQITVAP